MKAKLLWSGVLVVEPENSTEAFALHQWAKRFADGQNKLIVNPSPPYEIEWTITRDSAIGHSDGVNY